MILYYFILLLTIIVTGLTSRWVNRKPDSAAKEQDIASDTYADILICRSQMGEIEAERKQGLLDDDGASEARLELARRLLAAEKRMGEAIAGKKRTPAFRCFLMLSVLSVPLFSWIIYVFIGSSEIPSYSFSMLLARDPAILNDAEKLVRAEVLANRNPQDGYLVDELADLYFSAGRLQDAANAYNRAIVMNGKSVGRLLGYAVALTGFEGGVVSQEAERAFREAARLDPQSPDAWILLARGLIENGRKTEAVRLLEDFLQTVPENISWRKGMADVVAALKESAPEGSGRQSAVTAEQRQQVAANVDKLAARLEAKPDDLQGWMMLISARLAMKEFDAARKAFEKGFAVLVRDEADKLAAFAREKGIVSDRSFTENTVE